MSGNSWDADEIVRPAAPAPAPPQLAPPQLPPQSDTADAGAYANQPSNLQAGGSNFVAPFAGAVQDPRDSAVWRKPDTGEIGYIGGTSGATTAPDGSAVIPIDGSSNPQYIASYLAKHPELATPVPQAGATGPAAATGAIPEPQSLQGAPAASGAAPWDADPLADPSDPANAPKLPQKSDELLGFGRELARPVENGAYWLEGGLSKLGVPVTAIDHAFGAPTAAEMIANSDAKVTAAAARGYKPGFFGGLAGNLIGSAPALAVPGGLFAQGATMGALSTTNPSDPHAVALSALLSGLMGKAGHMVTNGVLNTIAPKISAGAQTLMNAGMGDSLTPGMVAGKHSLWGIGEGAAQAVPIVGEMLRAQGNRALIAANRAVADRVASGFGGQAAGDTAEDLMRSVQTAKNNAYNISTPNGTQLDPVYANTVNGIRSQVAGIPAATGLPQSFDRLIQTEIAARAHPITGTLDDAGITSAKNAISKEIAAWSGDSNGWARQYTGHLKDLRNALTSNLGRADPAAQAQLSQADASYPLYKVLQDAMRRGTQNSTNEPGWFTPQQFQSAITANTSPERLVTGGAPMQDLATAMKDVLPRKFKDVVSPWHAVPEALVASGVAGADIFGGHGGALTAGMMAGIPMYSQTGQATLRQMLLSLASKRASLESSIGPLQGYAGAAAAPLGGFFGRAGAQALYPSTAPAH